MIAHRPALLPPPRQICGCILLRQNKSRVSGEIYSRSAMTRHFWEDRYNQAGFVYGTAPNRFLEQSAVGWPPGLRVLVPGDGECRNGIWLARQGHSVLSVDQAQAGLDKAATLSEQYGVSIDTLCADLTSWVPQPATFDALVLIFLHLPTDQRSIVHRRLLTALRPGARVLVECFDRSHLGLPGGGPRDADLLPTEADLRADFSMLMELKADIETTELDEGPYHRGDARVLRLTGRMPGDG